MEIIDIKTLESIQTIPIQGVLCRYSKDGSRILINQGWKKATNIWDVKTNTNILEIDTKDFYHEWNHDESKIVFGAHSDQQSAVLDVESGEMITFDYEHQITSGASFSPDGTRILTHSHLERNFFIWNLKNNELEFTLNYGEKISTGSETRTLMRHKSAIARFTPDGNKIISISSFR